jgi:hypothetical protein
MDPSNTKTSILYLPDEILLFILSGLDYVSAVTMTMVHPRFWNFTDPAKSFSRCRKTCDIEYAERHFARFATRFACYGCFRILPWSHFCDMEMTGPKAKSWRRSARTRLYLSCEDGLSVETTPIYSLNAGNERTGLF